eukprot:403355588
MLESFKEDAKKEIKDLRQLIQGDDPDTRKIIGGVPNIFSINGDNLEHHDDLHLRTSNDNSLDSHSRPKTNAKAQVGIKSNINGNKVQADVDFKASSDQYRPNQHSAINSSNMKNDGLRNLNHKEDIQDKADFPNYEDPSLEEIKSIDQDDFDFENDLARDPNDDEIGGEEPVELLRRGTTQIFPLDADNELSYSKLQTVIHQNHPRVEIEMKGGRKEYKQLPYGKTRIGWHCCCRPCRQSDISKYGEGVTYYFKMLKFLIILFSIASVINIPLFVLYSVGGGTNNQTGLKYYLSGLSLAYMGENTMACNFDQVLLPNDTSLNIYMQCEQGRLCDLKAFGLDYATGNTSSLSSCNKDKYIFYDQNCNLTQFSETDFNYVADSYDDQCRDKQSCNFTLSLAKLPTSCRNFTGNRTVFMQAQCAVTGITLDTSYIDKGQVAIIIAIFDVIFVIIFGVSLLILKCLQDLEHLEIKGITIDASKFTIMLSGLPPHKNIYYLKAEIWKWAENQLKRINQEKQDDNGSGQNTPSNKINNEKLDKSKIDKFQKTDQEVHDEDGVPEHQNMIHRLDDPSPLQSQNRKDNPKDPREQDAKNNKIVDITLGLMDYDNVIHLCYLNMFFKQLKLNLLRLEKVKAPNMRVKIEKQIEVLNVKIQARLDMYDAWMKNNVQMGIVAFIQFRSMLDMVKFLTGFDLTFFENFFFCCKKKQPHIQTKMLQGTWPKMLKSPDPANLLWVNLPIVSLILMAGSFIAIIYAKDFEKQVQLRYNMNQDCGTLTYTQAQVIYQEQQASIQTSTSFNYLHCYCLSQYKTSGTDVVDIKFADGKYYCKDWAFDYAISNMFVYVIAFIIVACNIIVKGILKYITYFEKPKTVGIRSFSVMIKIFLVQFVNTVMILILVNWRINRKYDMEVDGITYEINKPIFGDNFVIFSGRYTDFTPEFYRTVGTTLLLTMIINIVSPNFINYSFYLMKKISQCCDRGCSLDKRRTKLFIQDDYEALYTGPELQFEGRYATLLTTFYACLFLSFGMPLFYVVGLLSFIFTFYVDKFLFLRHYRLPPLGDRNLSLWSRILMAVAIMIHLIIAFMMISNNLLFGKICGLPDFSDFKAELTATLDSIPFIHIIFDPKRFEFAHSILIFVVMFIAVAIVVLVIVLGSFLYSLYISCKKTFKSCKKYCQPGGCCAGCSKCATCCNIGACFKKMFSACCCCKKPTCCEVGGMCSPDSCMRCGCLKASCFQKLFCCCKDKFDIVDGMKILMDYTPKISLDFYKEISLYELRLLYLRTNYELKRLELALRGDFGVYGDLKVKGSIEAPPGIQFDLKHPEAFVEQRLHFLYRKAAIELEVKVRLQELQILAKIPGDLDLNLEADLLKGLDASLRLKGSLIHLKRLSGLFSYDIKFSPEYSHCIKMKEKLPELRKLLQGKKEIKSQDNSQNKL